VNTQTREHERFATADVCVTTTNGRAATADGFVSTADGLVSAAYERSSSSAGGSDD
jgi:hypothetical protein